MMLAVVVAGAVAALPSLPEVYSVKLKWAECGGGTGGTCANDTRVGSFKDGYQADKFLTVAGKKSDLHVMTDHDYQWSWHDGASDCDRSTMGYPIESDWVWLKYDTTTEGDNVSCPNGAGGTCRYFYGPWPEQITSRVQLWVRTESNGAATPIALQMECAILPFTIYKTYLGFVKFEPSAMKFDPSCNTTETATVEESIPLPHGLGAKGLGPYKSAWRRHVNNVRIKAFD